MALTQYLKMIGLSINELIFSYLAIFIYWLSNLVKKYAAVARRLESSLYIH